jgi:hypothetical protein
VGLPRSGFRPDNRLEHRSPDGDTAGCSRTLGSGRSVAAVGGSLLDACVSGAGTQGASAWSVCRPDASVADQAWTSIGSAGCRSTVCVFALIPAGDPTLGRGRQEPDHQAQHGEIEQHLHRHE